MTLSPFPRPQGDPGATAPAPAAGDPSLRPHLPDDLFDYALVRDAVGFTLRSVRRHRWLAGATALLVLAAAASSLWLLPSRWQVQARLLAQKNPVMWTLSNPLMPRPFDWDTPSRAARETVLRRDNLVALCRQTDFVDKYLATRAPAVRAWQWLRDRVGTPKSKDELLEDLVDTLQDRLWVDVGADGVVTITFEWSNRDIAYQMVQAALNNFLDIRHSQEAAMVGETIAILEVHAAKMKRQIDQGVDELRAKEALYGHPGPRAAPRGAAAVAPRAADSDEVAGLRAMLAVKRRTLADLLEFRQQRLVEQQAQLAKLQAVYAEQHPDVVAARQNLEALSGPSPQINQLQDDVSNLEKDIVSRGGTLGRAARELVPVPAVTERELAPGPDDLRNVDPRLEYERGQLRQLLRQYTDMLDRIQGARVDLDTVKAAFKYRYSVITPPILPKKPIRPKPPLVLAAGLLGGLLVGIFAAVLVDARSGRVLERWQIERLVGVRVLAEPRA